ncbi:hypothetical protein [Metallibacterium scheffleri]
MKLFIRTFAVLLAVCLDAPAMAATIQIENNMPITVPAPATLPSYRVPSGHIQMPACYFAHVLGSHGTPQEALESLNTQCLIKSAAYIGYAEHVGNFAKSLVRCAALVSKQRPQWTIKIDGWRCYKTLLAHARDGSMPFTH